MAEQIALYPQEELQRIAEEMAALRIPDETLRAMRESVAAYDQVMEGFREAAQVTAAFRIPDETLRAMRESVVAYDQVMEGFREAAQVTAAFRIPEETLRAMQQVADRVSQQAAAMQQIAEGALQQVSAFRIPDETTDRAAEGTVLSLDSEPEGEPDKPDEQSGVGDK